MLKILVLTPKFEEKNNDVLLFFFSANDIHGDESLRRF